MDIPEIRIDIRYNNPVLDIERVEIQTNVIWPWPDPIAKRDYTLYREFSSIVISDTPQFRKKHPRRGEAEQLRTIVKHLEMFINYLEARED